MLIFPLNLDEKLNCRLGHVTSGPVTSIISLNLAEKPNRCGGHGTSLFPAKRGGEIDVR